MSISKIDLKSLSNDKHFQFGSYLVIVEATDNNGAKYRYSAKIGVKR